MRFTLIRSSVVSKLELQVPYAVTVSTTTERVLLNLIKLSVDIINETYACENDKLLNDVLKREVGFQGYVMTDWGAKYSTEAIMAGLDVGCF